jgi:hypothetical protein
MAIQVPIKKMANAIPKSSKNVLDEFFLQNGHIFASAGIIMAQWRHFFSSIIPS